MSKPELSLSVLLLGLVSLVAQVSADEATLVRNLLERMSHAVSSMDYEGVFVYQRGKQLETFHIVHRATKAGERERLVALNGAPREILRTGDVVTCVLAGDRSLVVDRRMTQSLFPALPTSQASSLKQYYQFNWLGTGRVADLEATVVGVEPKDAYRYGYRLWLEKDTGMLLKSALIGHDGEVIEQVMFTRINIGGNVSVASLRPDYIEPKLQVGPIPPLPQPEPVPEGGFEWIAAQLPPGFRLKVHQWQRLNENVPPAEHLVFTDGLASVSVYVEHSDAVSAQAPEGISRLGAVSAYIRELENHRITAVGEVPAITVKAIASSVHSTGNELAAHD